MSKPMMALYWCASCGGCEEAMLDLNNSLLKLTEAFNIVFWPVALDYKYSDLEALEDKSILVSFINGAIRNSENEKMASLLRKKSKIIIAFGSCAHIGGIPALANFNNNKDILNSIYLKAPGLENKENILPEEVSEIDGLKLKLPKFYNKVLNLSKVIEVDYSIPGCPPPAKLIIETVNNILKKNHPNKGAVLSPNKALCNTCERNKTKSEIIKVKDIKRIHEINDDGRCFLEQGVICLGPVTRTGCDERCISANMPCRGCLGPLDDIIDIGAKFISTFSTILETNDENEINGILEKVFDIGGTVYRYNLSNSLIDRNIKVNKE